VYEARRQRPLFEKLPSAHRRAVPQQSKKPKNFLVRLRQVPSSERAELLRAFVHDQVAGVLGVNHAQSLDAKQGFFRMGMDSLMSVQLRQRLENSLDGCSLPLTLAFEYPNIEALTRYLAKEVLNLDTAAPRTNIPVDGVHGTNPQDNHGPLSEDELVDLLAKKLEQFR
jgi:acyl carrier protein